MTVLSMSASVRLWGPGDGTDADADVCVCVELYVETMAKVRQ